MSSKSHVCSFPYGAERCIVCGSPKPDMITGGRAGTEKLMGCFVEPIHANDPIEFGQVTRSHKEPYFSHGKIWIEPRTF